MNQKMVAIMSAEIEFLLDYIILGGWKRPYNAPQQY
jgi:hypothetical protein